MTDTNFQNTVSASQKELVLPSIIDSIDEAATAAAQAAAANGVSDDAMFGIDLAVREAVANAVKHGNKLDETKNVRISFIGLPDKFEITVEDEGEGFDFEHLPDPTDPANLLKESGRGIFLMRNFMDEVSWQIKSGGTILKMSKQL